MSLGQTWCRPSPRRVHQLPLHEGPDGAGVGGGVVPSAGEAAAEARLEDLGQHAERGEKRWSKTHSSPLAFVTSPVLRSVSFGTAT